VDARREPRRGRLVGGQRRELRLGVVEVPRGEGDVAHRPPGLGLLAGAAAAPLELTLARLAGDHRPPSLPLTVFARARLEGDRLAILPSQGAGDLTSLARAGFAGCDPAITALPAGALVLFSPCWITCAGRTVPAG
jgi:hypothetical protein